ncbi:hypothetical protein IJT93_12705 [bacterium]|nr:hypothetical protein [bacterium]
MDSFFDDILIEHYDRIMAEAMAEGRAEGIAQGRAEGKESERVRSIKNILQSLNMTVQQAMDALRIPPEEQEKYLLKSDRFSSEQQKAQSIPVPLRTQKGWEELVSFFDDMLIKHYDRIMAETIAEGIAEGKAEGICQARAVGKVQGIIEGKAEGKESERVRSIKNIMYSLNLNVQQAMDALRIPLVDQEKYLLKSDRFNMPDLFSANGPSARK